MSDPVRIFLIGYLLGGLIASILIFIAVTLFHWFLKPKDEIDDLNRVINQIEEYSKLLLMKNDTSQSRAWVDGYNTCKEELNYIIRRLKDEINDNAEK